MLHAEYRLESFISERDAELKRLKLLEPQYRNSPTPSICTRISQCISKIRALNGRIAKLGIRYNIVRVWGKYVVPTQKKGGITYSKSFEIYFTDITEYDAKLLMELHFKEYGVAEIHTQTIPVGRLNKSVI